MQRQYVRVQVSEKGGQMARPQKCRCICSKPKVTEFSAKGASEQNCVNLTLDEYEVMRLLDFVNLNQEQCAVKMAISRPTVTRIYNSARQKIADALVNGRSITISGGDVTVCEAIRPECVNEKYCCHRQLEEEADIRGRRIQYTNPF